MSKAASQTRWMATALLICATAGEANAETAGEARFFADCLQRRAIHLHDESSPWDLHAAVYTTLGLAEVEVVRLADWVIDLPLPGRSLRPFERTTRAIRAGYSRLPPWLIRRRLGQFVDAFQIPELSLGDTSAAYSVATGAGTAIGSGTVLRVNKLVDWTQHVIGDVNRLGGSPLRRPQGLVPWSLPGRAVDGVQRLFMKAFHRAGVMVARTVEHSLTVVETAGEAMLNVGCRRPHQETTVFLRLPMEVYRAHELWILEHRTRLVIGTRESLARSTHAALTHRRRPSAHEWSPLDQSPQPAEVIVMTGVAVMSRAPTALIPYVVPAAWILNGEASH